MAMATSFLRSLTLPARHWLLDSRMTMKPRWDDAARLFEQATRAGVHDAPALMLQALAYKHLGRTGEARQLLSHINQPDADVFIQRGLLAFKEKEFAVAAEDFQAALARDSSSF